MINRKKRIIESFDKLAMKRNHWIKKNNFFYQEDQKYMKFLIPKGLRVIEIGCGDGTLLNSLNPSYGLGIDFSQNMIDVASENFKHLNFQCLDIEKDSIKPANEKFDIVILSDTLGYFDDCQSALNNILCLCAEDTRLIIAQHSWKWEPILKLAEKLRLKMPSPDLNWFSQEDVSSFLNLTGFELVKKEYKFLMPKNLFGFGFFVNAFFSHLPIIRQLNLRNYYVAKPINLSRQQEMSTSIVIPCRNEKGNIENAIKRIPNFTDIELIFVEGNSSDGTLQEINSMIKKYPSHDIKVYVQDGIGKGDAVRKGFSNARGEILMILDADLTVPPEDLPKFYEAIVNGKGDFINGSRLVYPMEDDAMRFLNFWANRTFSIIFSWLLNQRITDTLCGTKVIKRSQYQQLERNRSYFGDFDPFGDFDLIFGAAKLNLKIAEIPIRYAAREYGTTQISRFRHGILLLKMVIFAFRKLKL